MLTARTVAGLADAQDGWVNPVNNLVCADTRGDMPTSAGANCRCGRRMGLGGCRCPAGMTLRVDGHRAVRGLPRTVDPHAGFVMTANNVIADADEPYISYTFSQPWRAERLRTLLPAAGLSGTSWPGCRPTRCCRPAAGAGC